VLHNGQLLLLLLLYSLMAENLVEHQLKVNRSYSVGAIVANVASPSFAFNVDDDST